MRTRKAFIAGFGTTGALVAATVCLFAIVSAIVAFDGWPGARVGPQETTLSDAEPVGAVAGVSGAGRADGPASPRRSRDRSAAHGGIHGRAKGGAVAPGPSWTEEAAEPDGGSAERRSGTRVAGAAGARGGPADTAPSPLVGPSDPPPEDLGEVVEQTTSDVGAAVGQLGTDAGAAVSDVTGQLGGVVGQVSPVAGQTVTQAGQTAGGAVGGTSGAVGQVVQGAGGVVGGVLGG